MGATIDAANTLPKKNKQQQKKRKAPAPNMYILYYQDMYEKYTKSYWKPFYDLVGGRSMRSFGSEVGRKWRFLSVQQKEKYRQKYLALRQETLVNEARQKIAQAHQQQAQAQPLQARQQIALARQQAKARRLARQQSQVQEQGTSVSTALANGQAPEAS